MLSPVMRLPLSLNMQSALDGRVRGGPSESIFLPEIDFVMAIGSSSTELTYGSNTYGRQEQPTRQALSEADIDVGFINAGVAGNKVLDVRTRLPALLTELARWAPRKGLVIIVIGANDINLIDVDDMDSTTKTAMADDLRYIVAQLRTSGCEVLLSSSTSRKTQNALYLEWAAKFYQPLAKELTPEWLVSDTQEKYDIMKVYVDHAETVPDFYYIDNLHPRGGVGTPFLHANLARFLNQYTKTPRQPVGHDQFIFCMHTLSTYVVGGINNVPANPSPGTLQTVVLSTVVNRKGQTIAGASLTRTGAMSPTSGTIKNPNGVDLDVKHSMLNFGGLYSNNSSWTLLFSLGAAAAGRTGVMRIMSNSNAAGRALRVAVSGGVTVDIASNNGGALPVIGLVPFTLDGSGQVLTTMSAASGTYAHMNAIEYDLF